MTTTHFWIRNIDDFDLTFYMYDRSVPSTTEYGAYSYDETQWYRFSIDQQETLTISPGQRMYLSVTCGLPSFNFISDARFNVGGNIMSILVGGSYLDPLYAYDTRSELAFQHLFSYTNIYDASELDLPATILTTGCYSHMFYFCQILEYPPASLPAIELADWCYSNMFCECLHLRSAPTISAVGLAMSSCEYMFAATAITVAPELAGCRISSLAGVYTATECYSSMFSGCIDLTTPPPVILADSISDGFFNSACSNMFSGCVSLTTVPLLPALHLSFRIYRYMFYMCTGIKVSETQTSEYTKPYRIPTEGDGISATGATDNMFLETGGTFSGTPSINTTYYLLITGEAKDYTVHIFDSVGGNYKEYEPYVKTASGWTKMKSLIKKS